MSFRSYDGYEWTEAGWRICNRDECITVPGDFMDTAPLRKGAPAIILGEFARRYDREIKNLTSPVWGWSATNAVSNSNHLGGVALDIDAPNLPFGENDMPQSRVNQVEALVADFGGSVYWGRWWDYPDEMHFQMAWPEGDKRYQAVIDKINGKKEDKSMQLSDLIKSAVDGKNYSVAYILGAMDYNTNKLGQKIKSLVDPKKSFNFQEMLQNIDLHSYNVEQQNKEIIKLLNEIAGHYDK